MSTLASALRLGGPLAGSCLLFLLALSAVPGCMGGNSRLPARRANGDRSAEGYYDEEAPRRKARTGSATARRPSRAETEEDLLLEEESANGQAVRGEAGARSGARSTPRSPARGVVEEAPPAEAALAGEEEPVEGAAPRAEQRAGGKTGSSGTKTGAKAGAGRKAAARGTTPSGKAEKKQATPEAEAEREAASRFESEAARTVATLIVQLQDPLLAATASRKLWEAPRELIPELIREVENPTPSRVEKLQVVVPDTGFTEDRITANSIRGLGRLEMAEEPAGRDLRAITQGYDRMLYGKRNGHYRVVLEKTEGFPVGVVIRAALLNRLQSAKYPLEEDDSTTPGKLVAWWQEYYTLAEQDLPAQE